ncbi:hypothetical protein BU26DRAFT_603692 [Trematosphaeria pertusa]|uniref:Uncharacterized protein n=1 Tax=Trematosphaeria pertusa TaxID=390896 RepID=A0A6A6IKU7_9PLEO|nr:uncharacterized protein BU26DRAFT_603692 [Trematosphaeria pertusa]KAF2251234.1 hypothetical protein BU26DRAFT_603692 [Trematosphaeria pertusa]
MMAKIMYDDPDLQDGQTPPYFFEPLNRPRRDSGLSFLSQLVNHSAVPHTSLFGPFVGGGSAGGAGQPPRKPSGGDNRLPPPSPPAPADETEDFERYPLDREAIEALLDQPYSDNDNPFLPTEATAALPTLEQNENENSETVATPTRRGTTLRRILARMPSRRGKSSSSRPPTHPTHPARTRIDQKNKETERNGKGKERKEGTKEQHAARQAEERTHLIRFLTTMDQQVVDRYRLETLSGRERLLARRGQLREHVLLRLANLGVQPYEVRDDVTFQAAILLVLEVERLLLPQVRERESAAREAQDRVAQADEAQENIAQESNAQEDESQENDAQENEPQENKPQENEPQENEPQENETQEDEVPENDAGESERHNRTDSATDSDSKKTLPGGNIGFGRSFRYADAA